jgi:hypothetical protein
MYEPKPVPKKSLGNELKRVLQKKYEIDSSGMCMFESDREFLSGVLAAGIEDAAALLDCIDKNGAVKIFLEY